MDLAKYSMGVGDRFGRQGGAQMAAMVEARRLGAEVVPVWNKSNREHTLIGSKPADVRAAAAAAVKAAGWTGQYHVDADHIGLKNIDGFLDACDFFTLDVADAIGQAAPEAAVRSFVARQERLAGKLEIAGLPEPLAIGRDGILAAARKYLFAAQEAGKLYRHIESRKGSGRFITEVSMDETPEPQTPADLLVILAALAEEKVPAQTVAPRFSGKFLKGVDYVGNVEQFTREFEADLAVLAWARREWGLPADLKLSVHSGSDKFSLYGPIRKALRRFDAGVHLKTAGTTWLEEVIGLAQAGGKGLAIAKEIYAAAIGRIDELSAPYATVIDIDRSKLPAPAIVAGWDAAAFVAVLQHDQSCRAFNRNFRQLVHVSFRVAAEMGSRYLDALAEAAPTVSACVARNLLDRHIKPLFVG